MKNIYITWHYTTHGIAYLKHILSAFYCKICKVDDKLIRHENINQDEMNTVFDTPLHSGFLFDKVYYLTTPQASFDKISSRRFYYRKNILTDDVILNCGMFDIWQEVLKLNWLDHDDCLQREIAYIENKYPDKFELFKSLVWRDMQHYSINSQIEWFNKISNASPFYNQKFEEQKFDIKDLRDSQEIAKKISKWVLQLPKKHPNSRFFINVSLGSNETQVVWHIFAESGLLPPNTKLLFTYDDKSDLSNTRLKRFRIKEIPTNLISTIRQSFTIYEVPKSQQRKLAELKLQNYLQQGFAILMLGERGTGKTHLVEKYKGNENFKDVNCASFDDDNKAESELFGHEKGAFTGADKRKDGLFHAANRGTIFLDEFHHLSPRVQEKLMKAMQTDDNNELSIRRMGATETQKVSCKIIMASNKPISELRQIILPDFYDRISQMIIELPALRETPEDRLNDWITMWKQMKFDRHPLSKIKDTPKDNDLIEWLNSLSLYGNYRDLQKIAISYHTYLTFESELKSLIPQKSALEYAKSEFRKYHSIEGESSNFEMFLETKTPKEMLTLYKKQLAEWAINHFGSASNAEKHFIKLGDKTIGRTLYLWRNGK